MCEKCPLEREKFIYLGAFKTLFILLCYLGVICHTCVMPGSTVISILISMETGGDAVTGPTQVTLDSGARLPWAGGRHWASTGCVWGLALQMFSLFSLSVCIYSLIFL